MTELIFIIALLWFILGVFLSLVLSLAIPGKPFLYYVFFWPYYVIKEIGFDMINEVIEYEKRKVKKNG